VLALAGFVAVRLLVLSTVAVAAARDGRSLVDVLTRGDARWYARVAEDGYGRVVLHEDGRHLADYAFFPLFPALERVASELTGLEVRTAGLLVSAVASLVAAAGVFAVTERVAGTRTAVVTTVLWAVVPVGVVQSMAYSESLFTALAAWSLHAVLRRSWLLAGALACAAGATRPVGAAVVLAVVAAALASMVADWPRDETQPRRRDPRRAAVAIAPAGLVGYLAWVGWATGRPDGYFAVAAGWGNGLDGGRAFVTWIGGQLTGSNLVGGQAVVAGLAVLAVSVVALVRRQVPAPLKVFAVVIVVLALTTSGYFGSKPRYLLPAFPLLIPLADVLARRLPLRVAIGVLAVAAGAAAVFAPVWLLDPGPP
jgi:hypothetical protein